MVCTPQSDLVSDQCDFFDHPEALFISPLENAIQNSVVWQGTLGPGLGVAASDLTADEELFLVPLDLRPALALMQPEKSDDVSIAESDPWGSWIVGQGAREPASAVATHVEVMLTRSRWDVFAEEASCRLRAFAAEAARRTFAERHHFVLTVIASHHGLQSEVVLTATLVRWWGWYGAKRHGGVLFLPGHYLELSPGEQLTLIEKVSVN